MVIRTKAPTESPFQRLELNLLRPREQLSLAEWSERYRYITQGPLVGASGVAVRWSNNTFPLQLAIMAAIENPYYSRVAVIAPPQAGGKTDCAAINPILKAIQHDNRDALYMSANALKAHDQWRKKFEPAIHASERLRALIPEDRDEGGTRDRRDFTNGCSLFLAGAESIGNLSGSTIPVIVCDDVQAMPPSLGVMGHAVDVAVKRSGALPEEERVHVMLGTAGTVEDYLWRTIARSTHFRPYLPCPGCGTYQLLDWERMVFDQQDAIAAHADCWMHCLDDACERQIRDEDLPGMLPDVLWLARGQEAHRNGRGWRAVGDAPRTRVAGFWWNALYWPFASWGGFAAEWVESRGDPEREKDFQQNVLVIPYAEPEEDTDALTVEMMAEHLSDVHKHGTVPGEADLVTLTADVHDRFLYYIVQAWRLADGTAWLVDAGTKGVHGPKNDETLSESEHKARIGHAIRLALEDLWAMEQDGWPVAGGKEGERRHAMLGLIDGGYRPDAVGQFCLLRNSGRGREDHARPCRWLMIRGHSTQKGVQPIWPKKPYRDHRGHIYWRVGVDEAKHILRERLAIPQSQPGAVHTYSDKPLEAYHRHMVSEHFVVRHSGGREVKVWEKRKGAGPNHWWDCAVYQIAAAIGCGVRLVGAARAAAPKPAVAVQRRSRLTMPDGRPFLVTERG